jgi:hypothetical protein
MGNEVSNAGIKEAAVMCKGEISIPAVSDCCPHAIQNRHGYLGRRSEVGGEQVDHISSQVAHNTDQGIAK